jgi:hypothetical protein
MISINTNKKYILVRPLYTGKCVPSTFEKQNQRTAPMEIKYLCIFALIEIKCLCILQNICVTNDHGYVQFVVTKIPSFSMVFHGICAAQCLVFL